MFIKSRDSFVTNGKYDCERTLRKKDDRINRRVQGTPLISGPVYTYRKPELTRTTAPDVPIKSTYTSGPVYTYHKPEPTRAVEPETIRPFAPRPLSEKEKGGGLLSKISAFFGAVAASLSEASEAELTPNVYMNEGDMLILQSMEESAVEFDSEKEAREALKASRKPYQSKSSIRHAKKLAEKHAAETKKAIEVMSALDEKYASEAEARRYNENRKELLARFDSFADSLPETGAYRFISRDYLEELKNEEIEVLLSDIQKAIMRENINTRVFNKEKWDKLEEYMLFAKDINVRKYIQLLDISGIETVNQTEIAGLLNWSSNEAAKKADFRYSGDVSHNWCVNNLKNSFYLAYKEACENGGKLDHDPYLIFPNDTKTRLSRFIGEDRFSEIAEKGARGKDIAELQTEETADTASKDTKDAKSAKGKGKTKGGKKRKAA